MKLSSAELCRHARANVAVKSMFGLALALVAQLASSAPAISARVTATGVYGNGDVYVMLDTPIAEPGCPLARFDVPGTSPAAKSVLATAQMALATGKSVTIGTSGCFGSFPTLDSSRGTFFYLNSN